MSLPRLVPGGKETLELRDLDPLLAFLLREVPGILGEERDPRVEQRLFPDPSEDEETNREWRELLGPEFRALVDKAGEVMASDLDSLREQERGGRLWKVSIKSSHLAAWISALNAARLTLATLHGVEEDDMERELSEMADPREQAILRIHLLGLVQTVLIEGSGP